MPGLWMGLACWRNQWSGKEKPAFQSHVCILLSLCLLCSISLVSLRPGLLSALQRSAYLCLCVASAACGIAASLLWSWLCLCEEVCPVCACEVEKRKSGTMSGADRKSLPGAHCSPAGMWLLRASKADLLAWLWTKASSGFPSVGTS